jgi:hypothetical protein
MIVRQNWGSRAALLADILGVLHGSSTAAEALAPAVTGSR